MLNSEEANLEQRRCLYVAAGALIVYQQERDLEERREEEKKGKRKRRTLWVRDWLSRRHIHGHFDHLLAELHREDQKSYKNFLRIPPDLFEEMVGKLTPHLEKKTTFMREPLEVGLKLAVTLRFLATGNSYATLQYSFRVEKSTISRFIPEVCNALIEVYKKEVLSCPKTEDGWKDVAKKFSSRWNYHNCLGAVDGKHVAIRKPPKSGSLYFNYKGFHSIVLMAVADAEYKFLYVDVGAEGGSSDGGTWKNCNLYDAIEGERAGVPPPEPMPNDDMPIPFQFVADDAFAMKPWLMKPFSHRSQVHEEIIFSYRLSRARRVVENSFGILAHR